MAVGVHESRRYARARVCVSEEGGVVTRPLQGEPGATSAARRTQQRWAPEYSISIEELLE